MVPSGRVTLIVNPAAGRAGLFEARRAAMEALLLRSGLAACVRYTAAAEGSAEDLARLAAAESSLVVACGGDGTVHGAVQGMAHTGTPLGVLPLGTANALARNLGLPLDPLRALERLLTYRAVTIPVGEMTCAEGRRLFAAMAGCGPDGSLVHALSREAGGRSKRRFGRGVYYAHAARLFLTRRWPAFEVEYRAAGSEEWRSVRAVAAMCSRVADLGGVFSGLTRGAELTAPSLHLQVLLPPARLSLPMWFGLSRLGAANPLLLTVDAAEVRCSAASGERVHAQADAEPMGCLPVGMRVVPDALRLMMPGGTGDSKERR